jgi:hypothetical protein
MLKASSFSRDNNRAIARQLEATMFSASVVSCRILSDYLAADRMLQKFSISPSVSSASRMD